MNPLAQGIASDQAGCQVFGQTLDQCDLIGEATILDLTGTVPTLLRTGAVPVDRLRRIVSVVDDNDFFRVGTGSAADFKEAAPHPLERRTDAPSEEPPSAG